MRPVIAITLCAAIGATTASPARAQDMQDTIGRLLQGLQGGQPTHGDVGQGRQGRHGYFVSYRRLFFTAFTEIPVRIRQVRYGEG